MITKDTAERVIALIEENEMLKQRIAELERECGRLASLVSIHFPNATMPPSIDQQMQEFRTRLARTEAQSIEDTSKIVLNA